MYFLFRFHHIMPSQFRKLGINEKKIMRAFMYKHLEDREEEFKAMRGDC